MGGGGGVALVAKKRVPRGFSIYTKIFRFNTFYDIYYVEDIRSNPWYVSTRIPIHVIRTHKYIYIYIYSKQGYYSLLHPMVCSQKETRSTR